MKLRTLLTTVMLIPITLLTTQCKKAVEDLIDPPSGGGGGLLRPRRSWEAIGLPPVSSRAGTVASSVNRGDVCVGRNIETGGRRGG